MAATYPLGDGQQVAVGTIGGVAVDEAEAFGAFRLDAADLAAHHLVELCGAAHCSSHVRGHSQ